MLMFKSVIQKDDHVSTPTPVKINCIGYLTSFLSRRSYTDK